MIAIGTDHIGFEYKQAIIDYLEEMGYMVKDYGTYDKQRTDYPLYGIRVAKAVSSKECELGILICGTGVGISLAANKINGIRAVVCSEPYSAKLSKEHNDTNILSFGSRVIGIEMAKMIVKEWIQAKFEGGRHQRRVDMIAEVEKGNG